MTSTKIKRAKAWAVIFCGRDVILLSTEKPKGDWITGEDKAHYNRKYCQILPLYIPIPKQKKRR